jgi:hypothetical protein
MRADAFLLGVNYWPQDKAMFMWRAFDKSTVQNDVAVISDLGLSCIRTFLIWEDFQPAPKNVSMTKLDYLVDILEMAAVRNLKVMVSLFTGYANGMTWLPPWMLLSSTAERVVPVFSMDKVRFNRPRNFYSDPEVIEAQIFFLRELTSAVSGHPALFAWDLGNDLSRWILPSNEAAANVWYQAMSETLKAKDETVPVTVGMGLPDFEIHTQYSFVTASRYLDFISIQAYPQHISWNDGDLDRSVLPYLGCLAEWLGKKPVLIQEFGLPTIPTVPTPGSGSGRTFGDSSLFSEDDVAEFVEEVLAQLGQFNLMGALWGSYGDYHPSIWQWPPLDKHSDQRFYGLLRHDGSPKPIADAFKSANTEKSNSVTSTAWIDLPREDFYKKPKQHLGRLYFRFRDYFGLT